MSQEGGNSKDQDILPRLANSSIVGVQMKRLYKKQTNKGKNSEGGLPEKGAPQY